MHHSLFDCAGDWCWPAWLREGRRLLPAAAAGAAIHGHIADQTGALIPGATVTITTVDGKVVATAKADASGAYSANGLAAGSYVVSAEFAGFAPFQSQPIVLAAGQMKRVDIAMAIEVEQQSVVVTDEIADGKHRGIGQCECHRFEG